MPRHYNSHLMKTKLAALLLLVTSMFSFGHGGVELGPNKGRILEFSKNETMHGEVTLKDGKFHIALLDKDMKAVAVADQSVSATGGPRDKQAKLEVTKAADGFTVPAVKDGEWLIVQFKPDAKGKAVTARLHFDASNCEGCSKPEWLCECKEEEPKKEAPKKDEKKAK